MYQEVLPCKKISYLLLFAVIAVAFCLLSLPTWLNWTSFSGIYELLVLVAGGFVVLSLVRRGFYEYTYIIDDETVSVKLKIGSKDFIICALRICDIVCLCENENISVLKKDHGVKNIMRCNGNMLGTDGLNIVYRDPELNVMSVLIFKPSQKFTEILQDKRLDKQAKM